MNKKLAVILMIVLIVIMALALSSCDKNNEKPVNQDELINVSTKLYFSDELESTLIAEDVSFSVKEDKDKYAYVLKSLIDGPSDSMLHPTINPKTEFLGLTVDNGICVVNFNDTLLEYNLGGSSKEMMCLYSVVNTLCEFDEIDEVIFKLNGETMDVFGHYDMTEPYKKNISIVK